MSDIPRFPAFRPIAVEDRGVFQEVLSAYGPETSEWTFTNLFIWRLHYGFRWAMRGEHLLVAADGVNGGDSWGLMPVGPGSRAETAREFLAWLGNEAASPDPRIERADSRLAEELTQAGFAVAPSRDQFDYVYGTEVLRTLAGRKLHAKRNHINAFMREQAFAYEPLTPALVRACLDLTDCWCRVRRCEEDLNLMGEWEAIGEALRNYEALGFLGGVIRIAERVEAFALGELLNPETGVVHIEKANPDIRGLYAMINQQFCEHAFAEVPWMNREQDLGEEGLRKAKLSYFPERLVEKFAIRPGQA